MIYEWDENKRLSNLKKHGLDFSDAHYIFEDTQAISFENTSKVFGEHRFITIGYYKKEFCLAVVIHTDRKEKK
ncbi:MAG: BrnT family toxin, partial [Endomicrobium sp.]|nr:BrnT family toxin [Endomicrobium sp.]